jgi:hypothetical protein
MNDPLWSSMNTGSRSHIETELTLVVCDDHPQAVCESIEALPSVGGLLAGRAQVRSIRDVYYDTPTKNLRSAGWGLRIRQVGADTRVALKGRSKVTDRGAVERTEIEDEWSLAALEAILEQLTLPCPTDECAEVFDESSANVTMRRLGLVVVQDRETRRKVRTLTHEHAPAGSADAELVIDRVIYSFGGQELTHHEIEIEAVSPAGPELISLVRQDLMARFGKSLRLWLYSKLATGWALERLVVEGRMEGLVNNRLLAPAAYDVIHERLTQERVPHPYVM